MSRRAPASSASSSPFNLHALAQPRSLLRFAPRLRSATTRATAVAALLASLTSACVQDESSPSRSAAAPAAGVATQALAATIPESVAVGTSVDLDDHAAEEPFALPPGQAMIDIVGIAIATSTDRVYTWFADGTVSQGYSKDLDLYAAPQPYTLPGTRTPQDVLGMGIGSDARTYTWYRDGMTSAGHSTNLGAYGAPIAFTVATGETFDDLIAIDIASDDRVYAWYRDGKRSIGTRTDLDAYSAAVAYALPPGQKIRHLVETAINSSDKTYSWFQDLEHGNAWPAVADAVDGVIVDRLRSLRAAGVTVAISKNGRIVLDRAYGYRDVDTQEARMPWHRSKLGSATKVLTALGVTLHAEQSPSFSLNSPVYGSNGVLSDLSYVQAMVAGINRHKSLVGFGISPTNRVYGWYENQTVSWGSSADLDATSGPAQPFTLPPGKTTNDILGMALDSAGAVTTWYLDGTYSVGTPLDLDSVSSGNDWSPASGASVTEVLGLAIRKSDNRVYAWYADGTYSSGSAAELGSVSARVAYTLPPGKTMFDLRDADFANTGVIYFHYGTSVSQGNASDLDSSSGLYNSSLASAPIVNDWLSWYGAIQVRHLLNHSAGLWGSGDEAGASRMYSIPADDLTYAQNNQFILSTRRLLWAPGAADDYSNHSLGLAGHVLSVASGMPFETFIRTKILNPLGLTEIVPNGLGDVDHDAMPHSTDSTGHLVRDVLAPSGSLNGLAAGGYSATAGDMVRLMLATDKLANHPDILASSSLTLMETPPFPTTVPNRALGWDYSNGKLAKGGDTGGGNAYIAKFPAGYTINGVDVGGMTIALCANGGASSSELGSLANAVVKAAAPVAVDSSYDLF
jgi:CubicO group peptidase (beta-lactamase class C family)